MSEEKQRLIIAARTQDEGYAWVKLMAIFFSKLGSVPSDIIVVD